MSNKAEYSHRTPLYRNDPVICIDQKSVHYMSKGEISEIPPEDAWHVDWYDGGRSIMLDYQLMYYDPLIAEDEVVC